MEYHRGINPALRHLWALVAVLVAVCSGWGNAQTAFSARYLNKATNGDIVLIGNINLYCTDTGATCTNAKVIDGTTSVAGTATNNGVSMVPIDTDSDPTTTNSSSALLTMPGDFKVLFAGLYWGALSTAAARNTVKFSGPTFATNVNSSAIYTSGSVYQSFADVTALVQSGGNGTYTVANIAEQSAAGNFGGWTMVVAFQSATLPTRNLAIFDGLQVASAAGSPVDITVSGFLTPSTGVVNSTIGVMAWDGDRGQAEGASATPTGSLKFGPTTASLSTVSNGPNPVNDVFNSTISALGSNVTSRTPNYTNTLGLDIDTFKPNTPLPAGSTSAVVRVTGTSADVIYPGVITLATDIFVPNIKDSLTKTVKDVNGGLLLPGDILEYELTVKNQGNDGAVNTVLTDPIPANTTYLPGSMSLTLINAGSKSDASGDDQAEYDATNKRVVFRLGTGATATAGGTVSPGAETHAIFRVTVNANTPGDTVVSNLGTVSYNQQTLGTAVSDTSDSDPNTAGDQPATIKVASPNLSVDKFHSGTFTPGVSGTFTIRVTNAGPAPTTTSPVTVTDTLPAGMTAQAISGSGWTCTLSSLTCTTSTPVAAGANYPDITVQVVVSSAGTYTNTVSVSGGGEGSSVTGNNSDSDAVQAAFTPPVVTLIKSVRNVSTNGTAGATASALPGQTLEYCVTFQNTGGAAPNFAVKDTLASTTTALTSAYGSGLGLKLTLPSGTSTLTSAADGDAGSLVGQNVSLLLSSLASSTTGSVCFQVTVK